VGEHARGEVGDEHGREQEQHVLDRLKPPRTTSVETRIAATGTLA
jgi:hypothetical protein